MNFSDLKYGDRYTVPGREGLGWLIKVPRVACGALLYNACDEDGRLYHTAPETLVIACKPTVVINIAGGALQDVYENGVRAILCDWDDHEAAPDAGQHAREFPTADLDRLHPDLVEALADCGITL